MAFLQNIGLQKQEIELHSADEKSRLPREAVQLSLAFLESGHPWKAFAIAYIPIVSQIIRAILIFLLAVAAPLSAIGYFLR